MDRLHLHRELNPDSESGPALMTCMPVALLYSYCTCSILGAVAITTGFIIGEGRTWLNNVVCAGTESRLIDCGAIILVGRHNCLHVEDAGVSCRTGCK